MTTLTELETLDPDNVLDIDVDSDEFRNNMLEIAAGLATHRPFYTNAGGVAQVYVCRNRDMQEVFRAQDRFTVTLPKTPEMKSFDLFNNLPIPFREDGEIHSKVRKLVAPMFGHKALVDFFEPGIRQVVASMLDEIEAKGEGGFDLMEDFAVNFIARILFETMLEFTPEQVAAFVEMGHAIDRVSSIPPGGDYDPTYLAAFDASTAKVAEIIADRKANPRNDFISRLLKAREEEDTSITDGDIFGTVFAICTATLDTTSRTTALVVWTLLRHPDQLALVRANSDELVRPAIEECMRWHNTSTSLFLRFALCDTEVGGTKIPKDARIVLVSQAASYDPEEYEDPLRLDVYRDPNHVAFGGGVHLCIGAPLARTIMQIAVRGLLDRFPNLRMEDPNFVPEWGPAPLGGLKPKHVPVRYD